MTAATRTVIMGVTTVVGSREGRRGLILGVVTDVDAYEHLSCWCDVLPVEV